MVGWGLPGSRGTQPGLSRDGKGRLEETADTQARAVMGGGNRDHVFLLTASSEAERVSPSCPHAGAISSLSYPGWTVRNAETQRGVREHAAMLQVHATYQGYACATLASISGFQTCCLHAETFIPREQDCRSLSVWAVHWLPGRWGRGAPCPGVLLSYLLLQQQEWEKGSIQAWLCRVVNVQGRANVNCLCHGPKLSSSSH